MHNMKIKKLVFASIIIVLFFLFLEVVLYVLFDVCRKEGIPFRNYKKLRRSVDIQYDSELGWRLRPNAAGSLDYTGYYYKLNSLGLRNDEVDIHKDNKVKRIFCLGGSSTFGIGVQDDETYPYYLNGILNGNAEKKYEVINAGIFGYDLYQINLYLKKYILDYRPDILILILAHNNMLPNEMARGKKEPLLMSRLYASRLYRLMRILIYKIKYGNNRNIMKNVRAGVSVYPQLIEYKKNLEELAAICNKNKIKLILCTESKLNDEDIFRAPKKIRIMPYMDIFNKVLIETAIKEGVDFIDADSKIPAFNRDRYFNDPKTDFQYVIHPNGEGNRIIAAELGKAIMGQKK